MIQRSKEKTDDTKAKRKGQMIQRPKEKDQMIQRPKEKEKQNKQ